MGHGVHIK